MDSAKAVWQAAKSKGMEALINDDLVCDTLFEDDISFQDRRSEKLTECDVRFVFSLDYRCDTVHTSCCSSRF